MPTLVDLLQSKETSESAKLLEGLRKLLKDCDFIVPDTSFTNCNLFDLGCYGSTGRRLAEYKGKEGNVSLFSLIELYGDISTGFTEGDDLNEIHHVCRQGLALSTLVLEILTNLLLERIVFIPSQGYEELLNSYRACLRNTKTSKNIFDKIMRNGYTTRTIWEDRRGAYHFAEARKHFFREQHKAFFKDFMKDTLAGLRDLSLFIDLVEARGQIVEDSGLFEDPDRRIIDGALELRGSVGIISCDYDFYGKTEEVRRLRASSKLNVPDTSLMIVRQGLRSYNLRKYQS